MRRSGTTGSARGGVAKAGGSIGEANDGRGAPPEFFEPVVGALVGGEQVDDEVAEIEEDPAAFGGAFAVAEGDAAGTEVAFEVFDEGVELEWRLCGRDDKVVGERRNP